MPEEPSHSTQTHTGAAASEIASDFCGVGRHVFETPFCASDLAPEVAKRLSNDRYAWLTTVGQSGMPTPTLVWFRFDGSAVTVYTPPHSGRITDVFEHPEVSLHLESDGVGSGLVIIGGRAVVSAEGVDPREDKDYWAKYHLEAEISGLTEAITGFSARITITPTTVWTTIPA